jgi:hypothetical protein
MDVADWLMLASVPLLIMDLIYHWMKPRRCPECNSRLRFVGILSETKRGFSDILRCEACSREYLRRGCSLTPKTDETEPQYSARDKP